MCCGAAASVFDIHEGNGEEMSSLRLYGHCVVTQIQPPPPPPPPPLLLLPASQSGINNGLSLESTHMILNTPQTCVPRCHVCSGGGVWRWLAGPWLTARPLGVKGSLPCLVLPTCVGIFPHSGFYSISVSVYTVVLYAKLPSLSSHVCVCVCVYSTHGCRGAGVTHKLFVRLMMRDAQQMSRKSRALRGPVQAGRRRT